MIVIVISYYIFSKDGYLTLLASLIGVTSLLFNAKGHPLGQFGTVLFSLLYGYIAYTFHYYGEMVTYLGMTMPMAMFSLVAWLKHSYKGQLSQVTIQHISTQEMIFMSFLTLIITVIFYFILKYFHTTNLLISSLSVATSFAAVYLTFRRDARYAIFYSLNDLILIALWLFASFINVSYISVVICLIAFFANDVYAFFNWKKMANIQKY